MGDAQLPLDQIEAGDFFGHRVLDLQARVHLHEIKTGLFIFRIDDELDRACANVTDCLCRFDCGLAHRGAPLFRHPRRRRFFQYLLMPPLHRAVALEQVDAVAVGVGEHLNLDVARAGEIFFDQHRVVTKRRRGFTLARSQRGSEAGILLDDAHALAATAG